jgi:hypothetical protein
MKAVLLLLLQGVAHAWTAARGNVDVFARGAIYARVGVNRGSRSPQRNYPVTQLLAACGGLHTEDSPARPARRWLHAQSHIE